MDSRIPIIIDTREQEAYAFDSQRFSTTRRALPAGDYSLDGSETRVAVERSFSLPLAGPYTVTVEPLRGGAIVNPPSSVRAMMDGYEKQYTPVEWA